MRVNIRELQVLPRPEVHYRNTAEPLKASPVQHHQTAHRRASPRRISVRAVATSASTTSIMSPPEIPPATLPGTPKSFHIPADKLIETAKQVYKANSGVDDPSLLADNFRFEFPVVSLAKQVSTLAARHFLSSHSLQLQGFEMLAKWLAGLCEGSPILQAEGCLPQHGVASL